MPNQYNINKIMRPKLDFFCDKLKPDSGIDWETPIAHPILVCLLSRW